MVTGLFSSSFFAADTTFENGGPLSQLLSPHRCTGRPTAILEDRIAGFVVSLLIFALGAGFSIYVGVSRILTPVPIESPVVSYIVLGLALIFEGASWLVSLRQFRNVKGEIGLLDAFKLSKDPPSFITLFEDSIALVGILIAAASTFAAVVLGHPQIDGIASVAIGLLLAGSSIFLARESKSLLMGEPAYLSIRKSILSIANSHSGCLRANGLITVQLGPDQIVAMLSLEFSDTMLAPDIEKAVIGLEKSVRQANPEIVALFVKPQTSKTYQEQRDRTLNARSVGQQVSFPSGS